MGALSSAGSGAATGATVGSVVPGVGTLIGAGIGAATGLGGSLISKHANNKATDTQAKAAAEALAYQKQKDAQDRADNEKLVAMQKAQWDAEQAHRAPYRAAASALLGQNAERMHLGSLGQGGAPAMHSGLPSGGSGTMSPAPRTLSSLAGMFQASPETETPQLSLSDVLNGTWNRRVN